MRKILISIKPEWVAKILNHRKTIEIRKTAPKCELPITVYIYCTKSAPYLHQWTEPVTNKVTWHTDKKKWYMSRNGKVVAKFTLDKIEHFIDGRNEIEREWVGKPDAECDYFAYEKALEEACLTYEEAEEYCPDQSFYAWHISELEIFDKPKELDEFEYSNPSGIRYIGQRSIKGLPKRAPMSWCYVREKGE